MKNWELEVIGFDIESCMVAQAAGADRIELCAGPGEGGTTPSYGFIKAARELLHIQLYPIIRPRGGDFLYSAAAFKIMLQDVQLCKSVSCDGVVIGMLNSDGSVDKKRCAALVEAAYPLGVTFHRAFDRALDPLQALEDIIGIGCERILTSGQMPNASGGTVLIKELIAAAESRISIMPGSGVRAGNIVEIAKATGATAFHSSAKKMIPSKMEYAAATMNEELKSTGIDVEEIKKMRLQLADFFASQNEHITTK